MSDYCSYLCTRLTLSELFERQIDGFKKFHSQISAKNFKHVICGNENSTVMISEYGDDLHLGFIYSKILTKETVPVTLLQEWTSKEFELILEYSNYFTIIKIFKFNKDRINNFIEIFNNKLVYPTELL